MLQAKIFFHFLDFGWGDDFGLLARDQVAETSLGFRGGTEVGDFFWRGFGGQEIENLIIDVRRSHVTD